MTIPRLSRGKAIARIAARLKKKSCQSIFCEKKGEDFSLQKSQILIDYSPHFRGQKFDPLF